MANPLSPRGPVEMEDREPLRVSPQSDCAPSLEELSQLHDPWASPRPSEPPFSYLQNGHR